MTNEAMLKMSQSLADECFKVADSLPELMQYDIGLQLKTEAFNLTASIVNLKNSTDSYETKECLRYINKCISLIKNGARILPGITDNLNDLIDELDKDISVKITLVNQMIDESDRLMTEIDALNAKIQEVTQS